MLQRRYQAYFGPQTTEHVMEKNSVAQIIRPAGPGQKVSGHVLCPKCGSVCEQRGQVFACPNHGTAPFEGSAVGS